MIEDCDAASRDNTLEDKCEGGGADGQLLEYKHRDKGGRRLRSISGRGG